MLRPPCPSPSQDQRRELRCGGGVLKAETQGAVLGWAGLGRAGPGWAGLGWEFKEKRGLQQTGPGKGQEII